MSERSSAVIEEEDLGTSVGETVIGDRMREDILEFSKDFKTSWVRLGQSLYSIYRDKHYHAWGFEKFEHYTEKEVGIKKSLAMKLVKTYIFLEEDEPAYLDGAFKDERDAMQVPGYEEIAVLRSAKRNKELNKDDYKQLRTAIFEKGKSAGDARKDLTAMMKEREVLDPDEERDKRNLASVKKFMTALSTFKKDMETLKLLPDEILEKTKELMSTLEAQL